MSPIHEAGAGGVTVVRARRQRPRRRFPAEVLSHDEVLALLAAVKGPRLTAARNRALLAVMYRSGLRVSEALQLQTKDLDLAGGAIRVLFAKGGRARTVGIDAGAVAILRDWLALRPNVGPRARSPVFCGRGGGQLSTAYVRRMLAAIKRFSASHSQSHTPPPPSWVRLPSRSYAKVSGVSDRNAL